MTEKRFLFGTPVPALTLLGSIGKSYSPSFLHLQGQVLRGRNGESGILNSPRAAELSSKQAYLECICAALKPRGDAGPSNSGVRVERGGEGPEGEGAREPDDVCWLGSFGTRRGLPSPLTSCSQDLASASAPPQPFPAITPKAQTQSLRQAASPMLERRPLQIREQQLLSPYPGRSSIP